MDSNIYEFNAASTIALSADFIDGCPNDIVVILSARPLSPEAQTALASSAERLGYGEGGCCWVTLTAHEQDGEGTALGAMDVRTIIEGLDPAACIATDAQASAALTEAYGESSQLDAHTRILGRDIVSFMDFPAMLADPAQKQRAWAILKRMGRSGT